MTRVRVNRVRFSIFLFVVFMALSLCSYSIFNGGTVYSKDTVEYTVHVVAPGETMWDIASANNPDGEDIRKVVYEIKNYNGIGNNLSVGQEIKIPV